MRAAGILLGFNLIILCVAKHGLDKHFVDYLKKTLKPAEYNALVREDLNMGSFGGGRYNGDVRPVIFIHGLNNEAGDIWKVRVDFVAHGHPVQQTFATSWGRGAEKLNFNVKMSCDYIQNIRKFIEVVRDYSGFEQVDVVGFSMGSPMARKAILGGVCVDNPAVNLGPPLTKSIHTFISVAGANQGSHLCGLPFFDICNPITGLMCHSKFLDDINSSGNYEASFRSYNLASSSDQVVGYFACGKKASEFAGAHEWKIDNHNHVQTEYDTGSIQVKMVREGGYAPRGLAKRSHPAGEKVRNTAKFKASETKRKALKKLNIQRRQAETIRKRNKKARIEKAAAEKLQAEKIRKLNKKARIEKAAAEKLEAEKTRKANKKLRVEKAAAEKREAEKKRKAEKAKKAIKKAKKV